MPIHIYLTEVSRTIVGWRKTMLFQFVEFDLIVTIFFFIQFPNECLFYSYEIRWISYVVVCKTSMIQHRIHCLCICFNRLHTYLHTYTHTTIPRRKQTNKPIICVNRLPCCLMKTHFDYHKESNSNAFFMTLMMSFSEEWKRVIWYIRLSLSGHL